MLPGDICRSPLIPSTMTSSAGSNPGRFINDSASVRSWAGVTRRMKRNLVRALAFSKIVIPLGVTAAGANAFRSPLPTTESSTICSMTCLVAGESTSKYRVPMSERILVF
jgi:hypothetical protein